MNFFYGMGLDKGCINVKNRRVLAYLLICISLLFTFSMTFWGLNFTDSFYFLNNAVSPSVQKLTPLSQVITSCCIKIINGEFFWSRFIVWFMRVVLVFIPFMVLLDEKDRRNGTIWIGFSLLSIPTWYILGPDIYTSIVLVCLITFFIKCSKTKVGYKDVIYIALINAISLYIRFPNIISIIISMFYIGLINRKMSNSYAIKSMVFFCFVIIVISCLFSVCLNVNPLYEGMQAIFNANVSGQETSHSFFSIFKSVFRSVCRIFIIISIVWLLKSFETKVIINRHLFLLCLVGMCSLVLCLLFEYVLWSAYSIIFREIIISLCIVKLYSLCKLSKDHAIVSSIILCFAFVAAFGSDTGLYKATDVLICFVPFMFVHQINTGINVSHVIFAGLYVVCALWCGSQCYEDKRPNRLQVVLKSNSVKNIITTYARKKMIDDVELCYYSDKKNYDIVFYGWCSHIFRYLYRDTSMNTDILYSQFDFHMDENDSIQIQILEQYLRYTGMHNVAIYVTPYYPEEFSASYCMDGSVIDERMKELNFLREDRETFVIYRSNKVLQ